MRVSIIGSKGYPICIFMYIPSCANWKIWGHGYVQAIFEGFDVPLWLKRY